jgi:hypothetical protein
MKEVVEKEVCHISSVYIACPFSLCLFFIWFTISPPYTTF